MNIGIIVVALGLMLGMTTARDISPPETEEMKISISKEELQEMKESMEPELFEGVLFYYEVKEDLPDKETVYDVSGEPQNELYAIQGLNVRDKPGIHGKVIGTLSRGNKVSLYGEEDKWAYIKSGDLTGYASGAYLKEEKPVEVKKTMEETKKTSTSQNALKSGRVEKSIMGNGEYATEMTFNLSFYTNLPQHNGGYSKTASGKTPAYGMVANNVLPFGTKIYLEGWGVVTVEDRGGSGFNTVNRLDLFIPPKDGETEKQYIARLRQLGRQTTKGTILN